AAAHGDEHLFDRYVELHQTADTPQDRNRYLYALAEFPHPALARRIAELTLTGDIRSQDAPFVVSRLLYNRRLLGEGWRLVRDNWDQMVATYPPVIFHHVLDYLYAMSEPGWASDATAFLEGREYPLSDQYLPRRLEELRIHRDLRARDGGRVARFLRTHQ
ncbi:MAG TPA: ERAP1-like C-terminal domain-containing protein, partial [Acidimicrobiia bacterium]